MELVELILAQSAQYYNETVKFYNHSKTVAHVQDPTLKRAFCKKIVDHFSDRENLRVFFRNNFTSESEEYFESLILSNPLNTLYRVDGEDNYRKIEPFRKCAFLFQIRRDYFAVPDEIFRICFDYFTKIRREAAVRTGPAAEIREYMSALPPAEYSYKMSRTYLDPQIFFVKYLGLFLAREITGSHRAATLLEESIRETRGKAPMLDTIKKFADQMPLVGEMRKSGAVSNLFHRAETMAEDDWLDAQIERFIKDYALSQKSELLDGFLKKLRVEHYFNLKSLPFKPSEYESLLKALICLGVCEVVYSDQQPVFARLSPSGGKIFPIMFPTVESVAHDMAAKKKVHRRTANLTPDFNYYAEGLDTANFIRLLCFADLVSIDRVHQFAISRESIMRSISLGMNFNDFKNFIGRNAKGDPPDNVMATVREYYYSVVVMMEKKCVLIGLSGTSERLAQIERDPDFSSLVIAKARANQYVVEPERVAAVREYFAARSIPVMVVAM